jgi:hypothetical protein
VERDPGKERITVPSKRQNKQLPEIAERVMQELEGIISAVHRAAEQISSGQSAEQIDDAGYHLYLARRDPQGSSSLAEAVLCTMDYDEYYGILERAAEEFGLCLGEETRLDVALPEAEFEENMITGGFEKFKGLAVEQHNQCLEELMVAVCYRLQERGFAVACVPDEDVIFYLPLCRG